jgi:FdhD protein
VDESTIWIAVNGARRILLSCSPADADALAVGHLLAEGWLRIPADVTALRTVPGPGGACGVEVEMAGALADRAEALRRHRLDHGCGLRHAIDCVDGGDGAAAVLPDASPAADLAAAFRALFAAADAASPTGGVHAAALADDGGLRYVSVDVARHCAVDRAIGYACLAGAEPSRFGLLTTARLSGAIAAKAATARLRWVASRSVATPLARDIARAGGVPLLERAARRPRPPGSGP